MGAGTTGAGGTPVHVPVMAEEAVGFLGVREDGVYIDGTVGAGGHAELILSRLGPKGMLLGIDRDGEALALAAKRLSRWGMRCMLARGNFADMAEIAREHGIGRADGILLDVGVSAFQLENAERGFSLMRDGVLDMRMDRTGGRTARDIVNRLPESELAQIIREFGEERAWRRIARSIVREREKGGIETTLRLAAIVAGAKRGERGRIHPATQTFQALRIAVNGELEAIEKGLESGLGLLRRGGRMAVISFHSLEDRLAKNCFREHAGRMESQEGGGAVWRGRMPVVVRVTKGHVAASESEVRRNPRARSAKLRAIERTSE